MILACVLIIWCSACIYGRITSTDELDHLAYDILFALPTGLIIVPLLVTYS